MDSGFLYRFLMFLRGIGNYIGLVGKMVQLISSHRYLMLFSVRLYFLCVFFFGSSECPVFVILFFEAISLVIDVLNANLIVRLNSQLSLLGVKSIIKTQTMLQPLRQITSYYYY